MDLAKISLAGVIRGSDELIAGTLLASDLENTVVLANGLDKLLSLINRQSHRLLEVHILTSLASGDRYDSMLVVRSGDHDRVDVRTSQKLLIVLVHVDLDLLLPFLLVICGDPFGETVSLDVIHIATGDNSHVIHLHETLQQIHSLLAQADESHVDLAISSFFRRGLGGGRSIHNTSRHHDARSSDSGGFQEISTYHVLVFNHLYRKYSKFL